MRYRTVSILCGIILFTASGHSLDAASPKAAHPAKPAPTPAAATADSAVAVPITKTMLNFSAATTEAELLAAFVSMKKDKQNKWIWDPGGTDETATAECKKFPAAAAATVKDGRVVELEFGGSTTDFCGEEGQAALVWEGEFEKSVIKTLGKGKCKKKSLKNGVPLSGKCSWVKGKIAVEYDWATDNENTGIHEFTFRLTAK